MERARLSTPRAGCSLHKHDHMLQGPAPGEVPGSAPGLSSGAGGCSEPRRAQPEPSQHQRLCQGCSSPWLIPGPARACGPRSPFPSSTPMPRARRNSRAHRRQPRASCPAPLNSSNPGGSRRRRRRGAGRGRGAEGGEEQGGSCAQGRPGSPGTGGSAQGRGGARGRARACLRWRVRESPEPAGSPPPPPPPPLAPAPRWRGGGSALLTPMAAAVRCPAAERLLEAPWPRRAASGRRRHPAAPRTGGHGPAACARAPPLSAHARAPPAEPLLRLTPHSGQVRGGGGGSGVLGGKNRDWGV